MVHDETFKPVHGFEVVETVKRRSWNDYATPAERRKMDIQDLIAGKTALCASILFSVRQPVSSRKSRVSGFGADPHSAHGHGFSLKSSSTLRRQKKI